jgi:type I restriction enzyme S subunit
MTPLKSRVAETTAAEHPRWVPKPLRFACKLNPVKSEVLQLPADTEVSFAPMEAIREYGGIDLTQTRPLGSVLQGYSYFRDGDVVVAKITPCFENGKGSVASGLANGIGFGTTELHVLRPGSNVDERFLFYVTLSHDFREAGTASMYGAGGQKRVSEEFLRDFVVALPPREDQRRIANFLDRKTAEIDALIAKKERMIALLNEKRQAVILHRVAKGVFHSGSVRHSGAAWLGEVPIDWPVLCLRRVALLRTGHTPSRLEPAYWVDCKIPWFTLADVWQLRDGKREFLGETTERISEMGLANSAAELLPAGTVVVSRTASVGFSGIMPVSMATSQDFVNWIPNPKRLRSDYLLYVLRAMKDEFRRLTMGSTHQTIYMPDVAAFSIPLPPLDEQEAIVQSIRSELRRIDHTTSVLGRQNTLLTEYRRALISDAVAGRLSAVDSCRTTTSVASAIHSEAGSSARVEVSALFQEAFKQPRDPESPARAARAVSPAFKRTVLAAEVISRMHDDPAFHKIKFQKTLFLAEHHLRLPSMETHYRRDAADPHDNVAMRSIEKQLRDAKWYDMRRVNDQYVFERMEKVGSHAGYFKGYWGDYSERLDALLALLRPMKTLQAEIVATLYAAWNDFLIRGVAFDDAMIVQEVLTNWNPAKERITEERWHKGLVWMREKGLVPTGFGTATKSKRGDDE